MFEDEKITYNTFVIIVLYPYLFVSILSPGFDGVDFENIQNMYDEFDEYVTEDDSKEYKELEEAIAAAT